MSINPLASISGDCVIESDVLVGAAGVVLNGLRVGRGATVGAAACAVRDVPAGDDRGRRTGPSRLREAEGHDLTRRPGQTLLDEVLERVGAPSPPAPRGDCFLTVVMRTQGRRLPCFAEALQSLASQTDRDFELVVVRHRIEQELAAPIDEVVASQPEWMRDRIRVLDLESGARGAPLNLGFEVARGSYMVILDDDDLALPGWVATFRRLHDGSPGRALRTVALRQDAAPVTLDGQTRAEPIGDPYEHWPAKFQLLDHLLMNGTPPMTIAFPRSVFHDLGERFDEELDTTEDWDFLLRAVTLVGVASTEEATADLPVVGRRRVLAPRP